MSGDPRRPLHLAARKNLRREKSVTISRNHYFYWTIFTFNLLTNLSIPAICKMTAVGSMLHSLSADSKFSKKMNCCVDAP